MDPHHGHHGHEMHHAEPEETKEAAPAHSGSHHHHAHGMGPAGSTYDLRFIDGMVEQELTMDAEDLVAAMGGVALLGELVTRELLVAGALILSGIAMTLKR